MTVTCSDVCKIFWAIFFPPIAVAMEKGCCTCAVLLNCLLTLLGWLPGQIHAFCVILHCTEDEPHNQPVQNAPPQQPAPVNPPAQPAPAPTPAPAPAPAQATTTTVTTTPATEAPTSTAAGTTTTVTTTQANA